MISWEDQALASLRIETCLIVCAYSRAADQALASPRIETLIIIEGKGMDTIRLSRACELKHTCTGLEYDAEGSGSREPAD